MKKLLLALAMGAAMTSCMTTSYDPYGYDSYGNVIYYDVYDDYGYMYSYDEAVIMDITNRMAMQMRLSSYEYQRLLDLNRRYFYIFHRYPSYSWGYYAQPRSGYARPGYGGRGPGYYAPVRHDPMYGNPGMRIENGRAVYYNVNTRRSDGNQLMMTSKQMEKAANTYDKEVRKILGNNSSSYNTFRTQTSNRTNILAPSTTTSNTSGNSAVRSSQRSTTTNGGRVSTGTSNCNNRVGTSTRSTNTQQGTNSSSSSRMQNRTGNSSVNRSSGTSTSRRTTTTSRPTTTTTTRTTTTNNNNSNSSSSSSSSTSKSRTGNGAHRR